MPMVGDVNVGDRVIVVLSIDNEAKTVEFLGYGRYEGIAVMPEDMRDIMTLMQRLKTGDRGRKIVLDDGNVVWGQHCQFGTTSFFEEQVPPGYKMVLIPFEKFRESVEHSHDCENCSLSGNCSIEVEVKMIKDLVALKENNNVHVIPVFADSPEEGLAKVREILEGNTKPSGPVH